MKLVVFLALLMVGSLVWAQEAQWVTDIRASVGLLYSFADEVNYEGSVAGSSFASNENTDAQFGFIVSAGKFLPERFGFDASLSYELDREISSYSGTLAGTSVAGTYASKPKFSVTTLAVNGNYTLACNLFFFAGLNFGIITLDSDVVNTEGGLGYQAGLGYLWERFTFSGQYRWLNSEGKYNDGTNTGELDSVEFNGPVVSAQYSFN